MEQPLTSKGDANMENTKKYNRKEHLILQWMQMVVAIRLVMEMLPAIKLAFTYKSASGLSEQLS